MEWQDQSSSSDVPQYASSDPIEDLFPNLRNVGVVSRSEEADAHRLDCGRAAESNQSQVDQSLASMAGPTSVSSSDEEKARLMAFRAKLAEGMEVDVWVCEGTSSVFNSAKAYLGGEKVTKKKKEKDAAEKKEKKRRPDHFWVALLSSKVQNVERSDVRMRLLTDGSSWRIAIRRDKGELKELSDLKWTIAKRGQCVLASLDARKVESDGSLRCRVVALEDGTEGKNETRRGKQLSKKKRTREEDEVATRIQDMIREIAKLLHGWNGTDIRSLLSEIQSRIKKGGGGLDLSGLGDIAYWLPKLDPAEIIKPGQIVALLSNRGGTLCATLRPPDVKKVLAWTVVAGAPGGPKPVVVADPFRITERDEGDDERDTEVHDENNDNNHVDGCQKGVLVVFMGIARVSVTSSVTKPSQILYGGARGDDIIGCAMTIPEKEEEDGEKDFVYQAATNGKQRERTLVPEWVTERGFGMALEGRNAQDGMATSFIFPLHLERRDQQYVLDVHLLRHFVNTHLRTHYEERMFLKLFCHPGVHVGFSRAVVDPERDEELRTQIGIGLRRQRGHEMVDDEDDATKWRTRMVLLRGEAGVGKTVWLQRLCRDHHLLLGCEDSFERDDVLLYVDVSLWGGGLFSLQDVVAHLFRIKDAQFAQQVAGSLERLKDRIVYCFDDSASSSSSSSNTFFHLLSEGRVPWMSRCVIALRPEQASLMQMKLQRESDVSLSMAHLVEFQSETACNLMVELCANPTLGPLLSQSSSPWSFSSASVPFGWDAARNPLLCQFIMSSAFHEVADGATRKTTMSAAESSTVSPSNLLRKALRHWYKRAADHRQEDAPLMRRHTTLSPDSLELLEALSWLSLVKSKSNIFCS
jgi:hypothetical protein